MTRRRVVGRPIAYIAYNHCGAADVVEGDTAGLHAGPKPVSETISSQPYLEVQTAHDLVLGRGPPIVHQGVQRGRPPARGA